MTKRWLQRLCDQNGCYFQPRVSSDGSGQAQVNCLDLRAEEGRIV